MIKNFFKKLNIKAGLLHFVCNDRMVAFCHASIPQAFRTSYKKVAFTLAEVLITLAIIGIVAALTIPVLNQKMKTIVVETRLKKAYAEMNQAVRLSEVDNGDKTSWQAENVNDYWQKYWKPYLRYAKIIKIDEYSSASGDVFVQMLDGSILGFSLYRDFNGVDLGVGGNINFYSSERCFEKTYESGVIGDCHFAFGFWPSANVPEFKYHYNKSVVPYLVFWDGDEESLVTRHTYGCNPQASNRAYCLEIIKRNNWKIPKDYPFKVWY